MTETQIVAQFSREAHYIARITSQRLNSRIPAEDLEQADSIPALGQIVLDFDHYGRLAGIEIASEGDRKCPLLQYDQRQQEKQYPV